jgi:hypothetical protein
MKDKLPLITSNEGYLILFTIYSKRKDNLFPINLFPINFGLNSSFLIAILGFD